VPCRAGTNLTSVETDPTAHINRDIHSHTRQRAQTEAAATTANTHRAHM